jgi:hypothetical protein
MARNARAGFNFLLWCLALGVLAQNVVLLRQNRELRLLSRKPVTVQDVHAGQRVGNLAAVSLRGALTAIVLPNRALERLVVLAISPSCAICKANKNAFMGLTSSIGKRPGWKVIWISRASVSETRDYCGRRSRARHTSPMPPSPSLSRIS